MKRAGKIRNLLCQENGSIQLFRIFKYKVRSILCKMKYGRKFKNFGRGSMLIKPDRIIGMECISIRGGGIHSASYADGSSEVLWRKKIQSADRDWRTYIDWTEFSCHSCW